METVPRVRLGTEALAHVSGHLGGSHVLTRVHRMGRKMVMVAGLLTNSVTMDTSTHASRVIAQGGRLLRDSIWCPIHVERPELCGGGGTVRGKE